MVNTMRAAMTLIFCTALAGCAQHQRPEGADSSRDEARFDTTPASRSSVRAGNDDSSSHDTAAAPSRAEPRSESTSASELIGKRCRVRFRRDVLGVAGQAFVEPAADSAAPGRPLYVEGTVQSVTSDAVVLRNGNDQVIWIPLGNVLMVETVK